MGGIELPFPAKILWPNGRGHHMVKHRATKKHREWAYAAARAARWRNAVVMLLCDPPRPKPVKWTVTVYPKTAHRIDRDNALASLKAYQDGIAQAMGLNDADFETPTLQFAEPVKGGRIIVSIMP